MEAFWGFLFGLVVASVGAWCTVYFQRYSLKQQNTLNLNERYNSPDYHAVRDAAWRIKNDWDNGDHDIVICFVSWKDQDITKNKYKPSLNGLWPHQNLSTLLHFFGNLARYCDAGLVDKKLVQALFEPQYFWYKKFIREFIEEYKRMMDEQKLMGPQWVDALPRLEEIFGELKDA